MIVHFMVHGIDRGHSEATLLSHAVDIQAVQGALRIVAGYGFTLGFAFIGLGLYLRLPSGAHRIIALVMAVVAAVGLVLLIIADHFHDLSDLYRVSALVSLVLYLWAAVLGVALYKEHPSLTSDADQAQSLQARRRPVRPSAIHPREPDAPGRTSLDLGHHRTPLRKRPPQEYSHRACAVACASVRALTVNVPSKRPVAVPTPLHPQRRLVSLVESIDWA